LYSALAGIAMAWYFRKAHLPVSTHSDSEEEEFYSEESPETESPILYHDDWDEQHRG
jgi:hypothetical protein